MENNIIREDMYYTCVDGVNSIHAVVWKSKNKDDDIRGVLQIVHGEKGYIKRYDDFARFMVNAGYVVVGNDHLGHGESVKKEKDRGYFSPSNASRIVEKDIHSLTVDMKRKYIGKNYYLMGEGMGSFFARRCIMTYPNEYDGVVIAGTGTQSGIKINSKLLFLYVMGLLHGQKYRSESIEKMCFGSYNKKFSKNLQGADWLTKDRNEILKYVSEPSCNFVFSINGVRTLLDTTKYVQEKKNINHLKRDLPILIISGEDDPVGDYSHGVKKVYLSYINHGMNDLTLELRKNDRHEILNETDRKDVYNYIFNWIESKNN